MVEAQAARVILSRSDLYCCQESVIDPLTVTLLETHLSGNTPISSLHGPSIVIMRRTGSRRASAPRPPQTSALCSGMKVYRSMIILEKRS